MSRKKTRSRSSSQKKKSGQTQGSSKQTRRCLSSCYNHLTENNYLCNNSRFGFCHVDKNQMNIYGNMNNPKYNVLNYKWDRIKDSSTKDTKFCYEKADALDSKIVKVSETMCHNQVVGSLASNMFGIFIACSLCSTPVSHGIKKYREGTMTAYELLQEITDKYINQIAVGHKIEVRQKIQKDLQAIQPNDIKAIGAYIRSLMRDSIHLIENQSSAPTKKYVATLVRFIVEHVEDADIIDVLSGAACVIPDNGHAYEYMSKKYKPFVRFSSHYTKNREGHEFGFTDYYADSTLHMLMGQYRDGTQKYTYFQFEGSPGSPGKSVADLIYLFDPLEAIRKPHDFATNIYDLIRHTSDFVLYKMIKRNIGSIGMSDITDRNAKWVKLIGMRSNTPVTSVPEFPPELFKYDKAIVSRPFIDKFPKVVNMSDHIQLNNNMIGYMPQKPNPVAMIGQR